MTLKNILIGLTIMTLTSCNPKFEKLEFNDTILRHSYTEKYGVATGLLNIYVVYGKFQLADKQVPAGLCLTPQGLYEYQIQKLLDSNPELASERAKQAAKDQKWQK